MSNIQQKIYQIAHKVIKNNFENCNNNWGNDGQPLSVRNVAYCNGYFRDNYSSQHLGDYNFYKCKDKKWIAYRLRNSPDRDCNWICRINLYELWAEANDLKFDTLEEAKSYTAEKEDLSL